MQRIRQPLRLSQRLQRALQLSLGRQRSGKLAANVQPTGQRAGPIVDVECFLQRANGGRVVAAAQLELTEPMQGGCRVRPLFTGAPRRERILVEGDRATEVARERRESGEIDEVRGDRTVPPIT